jgi:hypothetical protein
LPRPSASAPQIEPLCLRRCDGENISEAGASVELDRNGTKVAATTTGPSGDFRFQNEPAGEYSLLIFAKGVFVYKKTRMQLRIF